MLIDENTSLWYVFAISFKKELEIRDELLFKGFDAYVPMHYRLQTIHGRKVRIQEPAVYGLVFVHGSRKALLEYRETSKLKSYMFLKSRRTLQGILEYVYVRDNDMENFRKLNEVTGAELKYYKPEELRLAKGEKVKIMDGPFEGITGVIQKLPHKRGQYLVVSLPNVAIAAVSIKPEYIQPLSHKVAKSTDVEKDSKKLTRLAIKVLIEKDFPNKAVILDNIQQLEEALQGCKVFLTNDKANYYFAFYAAALATGEDTAVYKDNLQKVMPRLKSNNLLLPTAHLLFYYETRDEEERKKAADIMAKWDNTKYSDSQKQVLMLQHVLASEKASDASNMQK